MPTVRTRCLRRLTLILSAPTVALLTTVSLAYACTGGGPPPPSVSVTPAQGSPNTSISSVATGLAAQLAYELLLKDSAKIQNKSCGFSGSIAGPVTSDGSRAIGPTGATIPSSVASGLAQLWWSAVGNPADRTPSFVFTVLGVTACGQVLYRGGSATKDAFTPRLMNDTDGWPQNGLSTYTVKAIACAGNSKVQVLDGTLLPGNPGLQLAVDSRDATHIFITPTAAAGGQTRLDMSAATRRNYHPRCVHYLSPEYDRRDGNVPVARAQLLLAP